MAISDEKKLVNYRLSGSARRRLNAVAGDLRLSHSEVLERLIERHLGDVAKDEAKRIAEAVAKYAAGK